MTYLLLAAFVIGAILARLWPKSRLFRKYLNDYLIWAGLPLFIFVSLVEGRVEFGLFAVTTLILVVLLSFFVFFIIRAFRFSQTKKASLFLLSVYGNAGYIGIPIAFIFFAEYGAALTAIFSIVVAFIHFSLGVGLSNKYIKGRGNAFRNVMKFPLFWGAVLALILSRFIFSVPDWLTNFSKSAIFIAPLILGLSFQFEKIDTSYLYGFLFKFFLSPLICLLLIYFIPLPLIHKLLLLLLSFLPPALITTTIAIEYKFDDKFSAGFTSISTLIFLIILLIVKILI